MEAYLTLLRVADTRFRQGRDKTLHEQNDWDLLQAQMMASSFSSEVFFQLR